MIAYYGWLRWRVLGLWLAGYCLTVWISIVYLGEHYVVDIVGGVTYGAIAIVLVEAIARHKGAVGRFALAPVTKSSG